MFNVAEVIERRECAHHAVFVKTKAPVGATEIRAMNAVDVGLARLGGHRRRVRARGGRGSARSTRERRRGQLRDGVEFDPFGKYALMGKFKKGQDHVVENAAKMISWCIIGKNKFSADVKIESSVSCRPGGKFIKTKSSFGETVPMEKR
jgi:hypothetical protein